MLPDINEFKGNAETKFAALKEKYFDNINWDIYYKRDGYTVKYGKDISLQYSAAGSCSGGILRHIDANKCLYPHLYKAEPKGKDSCDYSRSYFDGEQRLVMSEYEVPGMAETVNLYIYDGSSIVQTGFTVMGDHKRRNVGYFGFIEHCILEDGRVISCETFTNKKAGITADGEYYEYEGSRLARAVKYKQYCKNEKPAGIIFVNCPDRIINPEVFRYSFEYSGEKVICHIVNEFSASRSSERCFEFKQKEIAKLRRNGISCFDVGTNEQ